MTNKGHSKRVGPDFAVVGIGASAGGVQALLRLFETAPSSAGVAFVVVLHLSPDHTSHAHDVIQSVTGLRVQQVSGPVPLEKNNVYVIPPGKLLSMVDGYLRLSDAEPPRSPPTSIDVFFVAWPMPTEHALSPSYFPVPEQTARLALPAFANRVASRSRSDRKKPSMAKCPAAPLQPGTSISCFRWPKSFRDSLA